jgi:tetratricopeptide (TPR) repeat protein
MAHSYAMADDLELPDEVFGFGSWLLWMVATRATALVDRVYEVGLARPSRRYGMVNGHWVPTPALVAWLIAAEEFGTPTDGIPRRDPYMARRQKVLRTTVSRAISGESRLFKDAWLHGLAAICGFSAAEAQFLASSRDDEGFSADPVGLRYAIARTTSADVSAVAAPTRTLPRDVASFTGRLQELDQLMAAAGARDVAAIHSIDGMAGVGKTAFAVHAAHRLAPRFPDGQIFLSLHGHTPGQRPVDPADAVASLLKILGVPAAQIPRDPQARYAMWRDHTAGKRLLLLLDDAAGDEQVRPLLPSSVGSLVLVTSRRHLIELEGTQSVRLETLPYDEAATMLVRLADRPDLDLDDPAVREISELCGYLPLAIGMMARQLHHHPAWTAGDLAAELASSRGRLELLQAEDVSVAAAFDLSYRDLSVGERQLFRHLGLYPGIDIDAYAAAALDGTSLDAARRHLESLLDQSLLAEYTPGRFRLHDLIRQHARNMATADDQPEREAALGRLLDYFVYCTQEADHHLFRRTHTGDTTESGPAPLYTAELVKREDAIAWMEVERVNLQAVADYSVRAGRPDIAIAAAAAMHGFLHVFGYWYQAAALHATAVEAARTLGDGLAEAEALTDMGSMQYLTGDSPGSAATLTKALELYRDLGSPLGEANALAELYVVQVGRGDYREAAGGIAQALALYRELADEVGEANALESLGAVQSLTGDYQNGISSLMRALALFRELGNLFGEANALNDLGALQVAAGTLEAASRSIHSALTIYRDNSNRLGQAAALRNIGELQLAAGSPQLAADSLSESLSLYQELGGRQGEAQVLNILGECLLSSSAVQAKASHERALALARNISALPEEARALEGLGQCELQEGRVGEANRLFREALELYRNIGSTRARHLDNLVSRMDAWQSGEPSEDQRGPRPDSGNTEIQRLPEGERGRETQPPDGVAERTAGSIWLIEGTGTHCGTEPKSVREAGRRDDAQPPDSGGAGPPIVPPSDESSAEHQRFLECRVPENVRAASEFLILARITEFQHVEESVPFIVPTLPAHGARIYVIVDVPLGCEVVTDAMVPIVLPRRGDSDEAWFVVRAPNSCSSIQISITVIWGHERSRVLAREQFNVKVHDGPTDPMKTTVRPTLSTRLDHDAAVLVVARISSRRYKYVLCRPGRSPVTDDLRMDADPRSKLRSLTAELSHMAKGSPGWRPAGLRDELRARGNDLWRDFLPSRIRDALSEMRAGVDALTISCANSTLAVPWEMLHPIDPIAGECDFLVQLFDLIRSPECTAAWCSHFVLPPAVVVLPDDQLPGALTEARVISEILGGGQGASSYFREKVQLQSALRHSLFGTLHFAAHDRDGRGTISMAARQRFSPSDLNEFARGGGRWSAHRPLVFVNACGTDTSRQIFTQFTSWAQRFFEAGAGGFVGSMWDVRSTTASIFAERFYRALYVDGRPFGKALHEARELSRQDSDPTWLAYAAHGDHSATAIRNS